MKNGSRRGGLLAKFGAIGFSVSVSSSTNVAFFFARNIVLARVLGPGDFGLAVIILTVAAAIDVLSDLGWDRFLIRAQDSEHPRAHAQAVVHLLRLMLGLAMAAVIALAAFPLAATLDTPKLALAIAALAVPILARAASHIDYKHRQREFQFGGEALVESIRSAVDFAAAVTAAFLLQSYWAMTIGITAGALASCVVSHLIARERFSARWDAQLSRAVLAFGSPLVFNNLLVYVAGQGDRLLVGMKLGAHALASYAAVLTLVAGPQAVLSRGLMMVTLPLLASVRDDKDKFHGAFTLVGAVAVAATAAASAPIILFGPEIVLFVFGQGFHPTALLCGLLAVTQSINILRSWAVSGLLTYAHTSAIPIANSLRLVGFAAAFAVATAHGAVELVAACLAFGELLGLGMAMTVHARMVQSIPRTALALLAGLAVATTSAMAVAHLSSSVAVRIFTLFVVIVGVSGASAAVGWRDRSRLATLWRRVDEHGSATGK